MALKKKLARQLNRASRIALLGVGSELRGDDAAGVMVARALARIRRDRKSSPKIRVFIGSSAPENFTGAIKRFKPTHLVIVDSVDMQSKAGTVKLIDFREIGGFSSCTHSLPIKILADYLVKSLCCAVMIIGIQPKQLDFGSRFSSEVEKSVEGVLEAIKSLL